MQLSGCKPTSSHGEYQTACHTRIMIKESQQIIPGPPRQHVYLPVDRADYDNSELTPVVYDMFVLRLRVLTESSALVLNS